MNLNTYICIFDKTIVIKYIHNLYSIKILHMLLPFPHLPKLPYPVLNLCVMCVCAERRAGANGRASRDQRKTVARDALFLSIPYYLPTPSANNHVWCYFIMIS